MRLRVGGSEREKEASPSAAPRALNAREPHTGNTGWGKVGWRGESGCRGGGPGGSPDFPPPPCLFLARHLVLAPRLFLAGRRSPVRTTRAAISGCRWKRGSRRRSAHRRKRGCRAANVGAAAAARVRAAAAARAAA
eukprot:scaffold10947_cov123-Isochrysis_galbana.AAC.7